MAGLTFFQDEMPLDHKWIEKIHTNMGYAKGVFLRFGKWQAYLTPKKGYSIVNWFEEGPYRICCCGTFCYKGLFYDAALPAILHDLLDEKLDLKDFYGTFLILAQTRDETVLIRDGAEIAKLYKIYGRQIYSTSFSCLVEIDDRKFEADPLPTYELLNTGCIAGDDTLSGNIKAQRLDNPLPGIRVLKGRSRKYTPADTYKDAVLQQVEICNHYMRTINKSWTDYAATGVVDVGLTGGLDSRYLAAVALTQGLNLVFHTHWRKKGVLNSDFRHAVGFAGHFGKKINILEVVDPMDMTEEEMEENFEESFKLCDGVIRPGCYWDEAYNTEKYRLNLSSKPYLRILGFGGEQYRNMERLPLLSKIRMDSWVRWEMIHRFAGGFLTKNMYKKLVSYIGDKVKVEINADSLNLRSLKEYNQKINTVSYRSIQTNIENKLGFCVSPFLDIQLSDPSKYAIPYLGNAFRFHLSMLNQISPQIAAYPNSYGFDFSKGEPLSMRMEASFWKSLPFAVKYRFLSLIKQHHSDYVPSLTASNIYVASLEEHIKILLKEMNYGKYRLVQSRPRMALNLAYLYSKCCL